MPQISGTLKDIVGMWSLTPCAAHYGDRENEEVSRRRRGEERRVRGEEPRRYGDKLVWKIGVRIDEIGGNRKLEISVI